MAALSRENIEKEKRPDHFLYADEIQNFVHGMDFPIILSEARKDKKRRLIAERLFISFITGVHSHVELQQASPDQV